MILFCEQFNYFLRIFVLPGLKPVTIVETTPKKCLVVIHLLMTSVLCVWITLHLTFYPHLTSAGIVSVLIYYASLVPSLLMIISANGQCFFKRNSYHRITDLIASIEDIMKEKSLRQSLQSAAFRYRLKILFIYIPFFVSQGLLFVEVYFWDSQLLLSSFLISLIRATHPLQMFHFILYGDIIGMFFHGLNEEIKNLPACVLLSSKIEFLKYIKLMHMNLWKLNMSINNFFGWNLLFTTMYWFIYITHQFYWIFISTHDKIDVVGLIGTDHNFTFEDNFTHFLTIEGMASLFYGMSSLFILVNSCETCLIEVDILDQFKNFLFL